jgi:hypothetical protein
MGDRLKHVGSFDSKSFKDPGPSVGTHDASEYNGPTLGRDPFPSAPLTPGYDNQPDARVGNNGNSVLGGNATK